MVSDAVLIFRFDVDLVVKNEFMYGTWQFKVPLPYTSLHFAN